MKRVEVLVIIINIIRNILIIFILFFYSNVLAKPLSYNSQISNNFSSGIVCSNLYKKLGFVQDISVLWIDTSRTKNEYALINTINTKETKKIFYLCKKFSNDNSSSTSNFNALKDLKVENVFRDSPNEAFKDVFKIANEETSRYILSKLFLPDFGVQKQDLVLAFTKAQKDLSTSKYITKKPSKKIEASLKEPGNTSGKTLCVSKSFNSVYRFTNNKCNSGEREILRNSDEYYKAKAFIENSNKSKYITKKEPTKKQKIVKKEPIIKQQKRIIKKDPVVKQQKRIVQKGKEIDKTPPSLKVKSKFIFDSPNYKITGTVSDKGSKKLYVFVNDTLIDVKKGKFVIEKFSPIDETLQVKAVDEWGNSIEKKIDVEIKIKSVAIAKEIEPLTPNKIRNINSSNTVAIIIGIEKYAETAPATYANRDAKFFAEYAQKAFGVKRNNMKLLINEQATLTQTFKALEKWLPAKIEKDKTNVVIYFAGHGLASEDGKELYLLVHDTDTDLLKRTALARKDLFNLINKKNPASVKMFFDTCYSGATREEKMLLASARGITIKADIEDDVPNNFTIFSASQDNQISSGFKEAKHGIFSYYLMKGMEGKADTNNNREISNAELLNYITKNVTNKALELGRTQTPSFVGSKEESLLSY
jgi:hypothetical protein